MKISKEFKTAGILIMLFSLVTGLVYPFAVTGLAKILFPARANGSMIIKNGKILGSELIGQQFHNPRYFWGRLSATSPFAYNAGSSSGSNFSQQNPALFNAASQRIRELKSADSLNNLPVPIDLVTSSSSGLDPHISIAAALYQVPRIARSRNISEEQVRAFINRFTATRQLGFLGECRVNVLEINLALDEYQIVKKEK